MKINNILKAITLSIVLVCISAISTYAQAPMFFWGTTCPHCHSLIERMTENDIYSKITIDQLEVYDNEDNYNILQKKAAECGLDEVGIPMLYFDGKCYEGEDDVYNKLLSLIDSGYVPEETSSKDVLGDKTSVDYDSVKVIDKTGKRNTEKLMFIVLAFLIILPIVGTFLNKAKSKKEEKVVEEKTVAYKQKKKKKSKKNKKNKIRAISILLLTIFMQMVFVTKTYAVCPVCTVAVGAGVGLSRVLKIDDTIPGVWVGGLCVTMVYWAIKFFAKRRQHLRQRDRNVPTWIKWACFVGVYAIVLIPLYFAKIVGVSKLWGIDKVILGVIVGTIFFCLGEKVELSVRKRNKNRAVFPFQKVVIPLFFLLLATFLFYMVIYY